jgi:hypothetical protein
MRSSSLARTVAIACVAVLLASRAHAQAAAPPSAPLTLPSTASATVEADRAAAQPAGPRPTPEHTGIRAIFKGLGSDVKHLPSLTNVRLAVGGGALAAAVHSWDHSVNQRLMDNDTAATILSPGRIVGNTATLLGISATVYAVGRHYDQPKVSHTGMDLLRSIAISQSLVRTIKLTTRRERPDGSGKTAFPSGHAADTFAVATALERHLGWRYAIPAYLFASYIAASRLPSNRHWLSDVTFGATVGVIAGRTVTRPGHQIPVTATPVRGGMALLYLKEW